MDYIHIIKEIKIHLFHKHRKQNFSHKIPKAVIFLMNLRFSLNKILTLDEYNFLNNK
jgi:hypothetical protein